MRLIPLCCAVLLLLLCRTAGAGQRSVTLYLDGASVEQEVAAPAGYLEYALPDSFQEGSLRVKPLGGASVLRVELVPAERDRRRNREIARLEERVSELQDRMQALTRQEEIFSAAVKSQSGKAPRKTKSNPNPVSSLQQGTDFALAQLEGVFRGKRKCKRSLDELERELAAARKGSAVARIWLSGGRARLWYLAGAERWTPNYDLRWSGDASGELLLHARLPAAEKGAQYLVSAGTLAQGVPARAVQGDFPILARYPLTLTSAPRSGEMPRSFAFQQVGAGLPPGEAAAYWRGEYLGSGRFAGTGAAEFTLGRPQNLP
jgi:hypothetical protein